MIGTLHGNMERAREDLIDLLVRYKRIKPHEIIIVFDGYKAGPGRESMAVRGSVAVVYSGAGDSADEVIKRTITRDRKEWIVVSSDRAVAHHAWQVNSIPVPSEVFLQKVTREVAGGSAPVENTFEAVKIKDNDNDDEEEPRNHKGNPHKLSKKEKSVRRALSKL